MTRARGLTVLVSSHILGEVQKTVDRVLIIDAGKILADGPIGGLFNQLDAANVTYRLETSEPTRALEVLLFVCGFNLDSHIARRERKRGAR